jgi:hypothetical protein
MTLISVHNLWETAERTFLYAGTKHRLWGGLQGTAYMLKVCVAESHHSLEAESHYRLRYLGNHFVQKFNWTRICNCDYTVDNGYQVKVFN